MENRNGRVVAAAASPSATVAEREVGLELLDRVIEAQAIEERWSEEKDRRGPETEITLRADTQNQDGTLIQARHGSEDTKGTNRARNALTEQEREDERGAVSQRKRKLIERVFGGSKLDRGLRQVKLRGLKRVDWFYRLVITAYNLLIGALYR